MRFKKIEGDFRKEKEVPQEGSAGRGLSGNKEDGLESSNRNN